MKKYSVKGESNRSSTQPKYWIKGEQAPLPNQANIDAKPSGPTEGKQFILKSKSKGKIQRIDPELTDSAEGLRYAFFHSNLEFKFSFHIMQFTR